MDPTYYSASPLANRTTFNTENARGFVVIKKPWTDAEVDEVRSRYTSGDSDEEIAKSVGRSVSSVASCRNARTIHRPNETLKRAPAWSDTDKATIATLYGQGWPNEMISGKVGRSRIAVKRYITTYKLTRDESFRVDLEQFNGDLEVWRHAVASGYAVSSLGRVMSLQPGNLGRTVKQWTDDDGYHHVTLQSYNGKSKRHTVHQLVATAFHGAKPSPNHQAAHGNGKPGDNRAENLRWATPAENQADRLLHGTACRRSDGKFIKAA